MTLELYDDDFLRERSKPKGYRRVEVRQDYGKARRRSET
jgi:hypothetical protein